MEHWTRRYVFDLAAADGLILLPNGRVIRYRKERFHLFMFDNLGHVIYRDRFKAWIPRWIALLKTLQLEGFFAFHYSPYFFNRLCFCIP